MPDKPKSIDDWLKCLSLPEYAAMTVSGHFKFTAGPDFWADGNGNKYTKEEYMAKWGVDPEVCWLAIKEYRKAAGKKDKAVML